MRLEGVFSVLPTPFDGQGHVDQKSLRNVVDLYLNAGINGVTVLGVTGEVARLAPEERGVVVDTVLDQVKGRVPVVVGATADGLHPCIEHSRRARSAGAAAVMVSPPRMPKLNSNAVVAHFSHLAEAVDIQIVVQDYPPVCGYSLEPWLLARIAREVPAARNIKLEDPPTPLKTSRILEQCKDVQVSILGGLGGVFLLEELLAGASGAMTGFAYPEILVSIVKSFKSGQVEQAADLFYRCVSLMRFEFQEGIGVAIRKEVLRRRGALADASVRAPGAALDAVTLAALDRQLEWVRQIEGVPKS